jgi:hypothetical protein
MSLLRELNDPKNKKVGAENTESIPDRVKLLTRSIAPILIPMISTLSQLEAEETEIADDIVL